MDAISAARHCPYVLSGGILFTSRSSTIIQGTVGRPSHASSIFDNQTFTLPYIVAFCFTPVVLACEGYVARAYFLDPITRISSSSSSFLSLFRHLTFWLAVSIYLWTAWISIINLESFVSLSLTLSNSLVLVILGHCTLPLPIRRILVIMFSCNVRFTS
ncbi:hypothetical protein BJ912DRAFT_380467 [Pholiota molesta]|nr:hypothetical protein BJ912DRAFT_380467 [Pholiota molesta]